MRETVLSALYISRARVDAGFDSKRNGRWVYEGPSLYWLPCIFSARVGRLLAAFDPKGGGGRARARKEGRRRDLPDVRRHAARSEGPAQGCAPSVPQHAPTIRIAVAAPMCAGLGPPTADSRATSRRSATGPLRTAAGGEEDLAVSTCGSGMHGPLMTLTCWPLRAAPGNGSPCP
ncbi:hypothetical protein BC628DRAFT_1391160 [Trametes gibbosa]|nr:hypothetical protein BC628DRAFT_1391160 [Trametes gibbosa]